MYAYSIQVLEIYFMRSWPSYLDDKNIFNLIWYKPIFDMCMYDKKMQHGVEIDWLWQGEMWTADAII